MACGSTSLQKSDVSRLNCTTCLTKAQPDTTAAIFVLEASGAGTLYMECGRGSGVVDGWGDGEEGKWWLDVRKGVEG